MWSLSCAQGCVNSPPTAKEIHDMGSRSLGTAILTIRVYANLFQEQQGGNTSCQKCGKEALGTGEILRALGVVFHPACFVCSVCNKDLTAKDTPFQADDAKNLFCRDCYNK